MRTTVEAIIHRKIMRKTPEAERLLGLAATANGEHKLDLERQAHDACILEKETTSKNLINDEGLNQFAGKSGTSAGGIANQFLYCTIGNSNALNNKIASGAVTFTQSGTTITASTNTFLTTDMVGGILKYGASGSAGAEQYITGVNVGAGTCTVAGGGMTVGSPTAATYWAVQQNALANQIYYSNTYLAGSNSSTFSAGVLNLTRTFTFNNSAAYNVYEIGWSRTSAGAFGRIVLASPDVVSALNIYYVGITLQVTYTPNTPTAVANVGSAIGGFNMNTAGNAQIEQLFGPSAVASNGTTIPCNVQSFTTNSILDFPTITGGYITLITANWTQKANTVLPVSWPTNSNAAALVSGNNFISTQVYTGSLYSPGTFTTSANISLAQSGQTIYGIAWEMYYYTGSSYLSKSTVFTVKFTTPQTMPGSGTYVATITFQTQFVRALSN